ncbi:MAG: STAS domain-containing protein [Leptospiraceae bacterium]|nr:STAS domain-containing protein [Leptospiraceae bacterium]MCP5513040.1 STAS domain-containing protein [Leptospiraceae bacterium]
MPIHSYEKLELEHETQLKDGKEIIILIFRGVINHENVSLISDDLDAILDASTNRIIVDLVKLEYINSLGLALFLTIVKRVEESDGILGIGGTSRVLNTIIQLVEISEKVRIFNSVEEALKSL